MSLRAVQSVPPTDAAAAIDGNTDAVKCMSDGSGSGIGCDDLQIQSPMQEEI